LSDKITGRVIIAREENKAAPLIESLREKGIISFAVPVTRIIFNSSIRFPSNINDFDWIVFTSANGVGAFAEILSKSKYELERGVQIAAVGSSTAGEVEKKLRRRAVVPEINDAVSLAQLLVGMADDPRNLRVFWPCGADALPNFESVMVGAGADVTRWVCYGTEKIEKDIVRSKLESLLPWNLVFFAAPSAVEAFSDSWDDKSGFIAAAIGSTTGNALKKLNFKNIVISKGTSVYDCTETIMNALKEQVPN